MREDDPRHDPETPWEVRDRELEAEDRAAEKGGRTERTVPVYVSEFPPLYPGEPDLTPAEIEEYTERTLGRRPPRVPWWRRLLERIGVLK